MKNNLNQQLAENYLKNNNFYSYLENLEQTNRNLSQEINKILQYKNPRQVILPIPWQAIKSYSNSSRNLTIVELGGTYLRLYQIKILPKTTQTIASEKIDFYEKIIYTPEILFSKITDHLNQFFQHHKLEKTDLNQMIFILNFSQNQSIRKSKKVFKLEGKLNNFGKAHQSKNLVGKKLGEKFEKFLKKNDYPNAQVSITNDSIISLLALKEAEFKKQIPPSSILLNLIVGTGLNLSVAFNKNQQLRIFNTEIGDLRSIPISTFDKKLHQNLLESNEWQTEKMFTGKWQFQLFNLILQDLISQNLLSAGFIQKYQLEKMDSGDFEKFFSKQGFNKKISKTDLNSYLFLQAIWRELLNRGAFISALIIINFINYFLKNSFGNLVKSSANQSANHQATFSIVLNGSVIEHAHNFEKNIHQNVKKLSEKFCLGNFQIDFLQSQNPTVPGSAVLSRFY